MIKNHSFFDLLKALKKGRMIAVFFLGFSSGLPIMLLYSSLKIWMRREGADLTSIGHLSWMTLPYTLNFFWSFLLDRYTPNGLGRRRGWLILTQCGLVAALIFLGLGSPSQSLFYIAFVGTLLCIFSATQDIAVDAYRREILPDDELGIGASIGVYGYRLGMLMASGFGLWVVDEKTWGFSFNQMFFMMAALMGVGIGTTLLCREPEEVRGGPKSLAQAVIDPFKDFLGRDQALWTLSFILLFKMGDSIAGSMLGPYYVDMGIDNKTIAEVTKGIGLISSLLGLFLGGLAIFKIGIYKSLWIFGIVQGLSTAFISILTTGFSITKLVAVVAFEDLSSGMGTAAMVAFMASLTNKKFTATQYALFASLASFGRTFLAGFSGQLIELTSYFEFFIYCSLLAVPGLLLLCKMKKISLSSLPDGDADGPKIY